MSVRSAIVEPRPVAGVVIVECGGRRAVCGAICGEVPVVVVDESRCCRGGIAQIPSGLVVD